ncbi:MAG: PRC-barrel domain containing protein [Rhodospirillales bacterium]|nr:MAG: PRC-barrel domain containing protein [Rhodospirillales bacterium]
MQNHLRTLTAGVAMLGLAATAALADQQSGRTGSNPDHQATSERAQQKPADRQAMATISADNLIGTDVVGPGDETVGTVTDLIIVRGDADRNDRGEDYRIDKVVLDVGGFLGIGTKQVAIEMAELQMPAEEDGDLRVDMTREELENLPEYERDNGER